MASNQTKKLTKDSVTAWGWATLILLGVFMFLTPFQFGFFNGVGLHKLGQYMFEKPLLYGLLLGIPAFILASLAFIKKGNFEQRHLIAIIGMAIPLVYFLSSFSAKSAYLSKIGLYNNLLIYSFFLLGIFLSDQRKVLRYMTNLFLSFGYTMVIFGFTYLLGNIYRMDALLYSDGVRLASFFTYPNGYAAFLITLLLGNLHHLIKSTKRYEVMIHGFMLVPIIISLLLTLSRGAIIMMPIIALVTLLLFNTRRQLMMLMYVCGALLFSLLIVSDLTSRATVVYERYQQQIASRQAIETVRLISSSSIGGWLRIVFISLLMAGFVYLIHKYVQSVIDRKMSKWMSSRRSRLAIPLIFTIVGVIGVVILSSGVLSSVLPSGTLGRLANINFNTHSVLERFEFYKIAIEMWKESPVLGGGGGAWEALYDQYQSYPFVSAQTHSYFIQILVETGVIGVAIFALFILYIIVKYMIQYFRDLKSENEDHVFFFLIAISILLHSLIDFEMSYGYFSALVFLCLGIVSGNLRKPLFEGRPLTFITNMRRGISIVWFALSIVLIITISNLFYANNQYTESIRRAQEKQSLDAILEPLVSGLKRVSGHPFLLERIAGYQLQAYEQTKDQQYIQTAQMYFDKLAATEPHFSNLVKGRYSLALQQGDKERGIEVLEEAITRYPYELSFYEQVIIDRYDLWNSANNDGVVAKSEDQAQRIFAWYEEVKSRVAKLNELPEAIVYIRPFEITSQMRLIVGQINFTNGKYENAAITLKDGIKDIIETNEDKVLVRLYLASLRKMGKDDLPLFQRLIETDPQEEYEVINLLND
ncbi:O-antigen ligase family protein [Cohnella suwonensis]|uniref:O-antigen ligase family protein n=1 Tax=Cohnella suwonensis TaxID=696072 RepID=A0ABW0LWM6_9BACL